LSVTGTQVGIKYSLRDLTCDVVIN